MNELRETIARIAYEIEVKHFGGFDWDVAKESLGNHVDSDVHVPLYELEGAYETAAAAIRAFAEAMRSDTAVEAGAISQRTHNRLDGTPEWDDLEDVSQEAYREFSRITITAALAAIGATEEPA